MRTPALIALVVLVSATFSCSVAGQDEGVEAAAVQDRTAPGIGTPVAVAPNGRYLVDAAGTPFFWLGDTAWLLSQATTRVEAERYLMTRAGQGFTVVQAAAVMSEERVGGTLRANAYGDQAFVAGNPARPSVTGGSSAAVSSEYDYWDHLDYIVDRAGVHDLTLALLPMFVGVRDDGYKYLTPERAYAYGLVLGRRYGGKPHVTWVLGGDNSPDTDAKQRVWHEVARGITVGAVGSEDYSRTLMTYHVNGNQSSSRWFQTAPWLDYHMVQVWGEEPAIYSHVIADYELEPVRPTGLAEGSYEDGVQYRTKPINALMIRRQAYWSYFAGGYHTYGHGNMYHFSTYRSETTDDWVRSLTSPGAAHMSVLASVLTSIPWWAYVPDPSIVATGAGEGLLRNVAMRSTAGDGLLLYLAGPSTVSLEAGPSAAARTMRATWIDPQNGTRRDAGTRLLSRLGSFTTPPGWSDALLLIEGA